MTEFELHKCRIIDTLAAFPAFHRYRARQPGMDQTNIITVVNTENAKSADIVMVQQAYQRLLEHPQESILPVIATYKEATLFFSGTNRSDQSIDRLSFGSVCFGDALI